MFQIPNLFHMQNYINIHDVFVLFFFRRKDVTTKVHFLFSLDRYPKQQS